LKFGTKLQGNREKTRKKLADEVSRMYKFPSKQISVTDFGMPLGMKLDPENRWVKKAELIPWDEIELRYAELFKNRKGNVAKPLRGAGRVADPDTISICRHRSPAANPGNALPAILLRDA
jgi:hypothetical protein